MKHTHCISDPSDSCAKQTYLINQHIRAKVLKRELQLLEAIVDGDLDGDKGVRRDILAVVVTRSSHDVRCSSCRGCSAVGRGDIVVR